MTQPRHASALSCRVPGLDRRERWTATPPPRPWRVPEDDRDE